MKKYMLVTGALTPYVGAPITIHPVPMTTRTRVSIVGKIPAMATMTASAVNVQENNDENRIIKNIVKTTMLTEDNI